MGNTNVYVSREPILMSVENNHYNNIEAYVFDNRYNINYLKDYKKIILDKINKYNQELSNKIPNKLEFATGAFLMSSGITMAGFGIFTITPTILLSVGFPIALMCSGAACIYTSLSGYFTKKSLEIYENILKKIDGYINNLSSRR